MANEPEVCQKPPVAFNVLAAKKVEVAISRIFIYKIGICILLLI